MSTITMLELRKDAAGIIRRLQKGEAFELSYRGRAVDRLEPIGAEPSDAPVPADDPIFHLDRLAEPGEPGEPPPTNEEIDRLVYGSQSIPRPRGHGSLTPIRSAPAARSNRDRGP